MLKFLKNTIHIFGANADAGVGDFHNNGIIVLVGAECYLTSLGECIASVEEVEENLLLPVPIINKTGQGGCYLNGG
ncbi:MAG: hypothetical protein ACK59C_04235, partial [Holosporales bacterium]